MELQRHSKGVPVVSVLVAITGILYRSLKLVWRLRIDSRADLIT